MSFEGQLTETIEIQSKENTGTDFRPVWDWDVDEIVDGLVNTMSETEKVYDEGHVLRADHKLYIGVPTVTVTTEKRIKWGSNLYSIYEVKDPNNRGHHLEIKMLLLPAGFIESSS